MGVSVATDSESLGLYLGSLYEPYCFGVIGPGFLNQVLTVGDLFRAHVRPPKMEESFDQEKARVQTRGSERRFWDRLGFRV